ARHTTSTPPISGSCAPDTTESSSSAVAGDGVWWTIRIRVTASAWWPVAERGRGQPPPPHHPVQHDHANLRPDRSSAADSSDGAYAPATSLKPPTPYLHRWESSSSVATSIPETRRSDTGETSQWELKTAEDYSLTVVD